jgi:hypothetical protein
MWTRTALAQFIGGFVAYAVLLMLTLTAFTRNVVPESLKVPVALVPMLPLVVVALGIMRAIRASDELQARIQFEALAFAFALTAFATFSYGFLELYAGFRHLNMFSVWPVMAVFWIVGKLIAQRRYA